MGCRLTRTESTEMYDHSGKKEERNHTSKGQPNLLLRDTAHHDSDDFRNGCHPNGFSISRPIGEVESVSQADFFRMLDAKIAHGADLDSENEA
ncbi:hypothetical protein DICVIV_04066 [Dictyocaulus viviparus]|uniref:Uncharacterized protein n=1 Tax=Dictyocaulus viviparus TaxID=29172 RepID=A0A0D8XYV2_DICVI|nr:hypothetical protein DICVIV_04066 [Dictyocaulus viviparus]